MFIKNYNGEDFGMSEFDVTNMEEIEDPSIGEGGEEDPKTEHAPEITVHISKKSACVYHFKFTAKFKGTDVTQGTLTVGLAPAPAFPSIGTPTVSPMGTQLPTYAIPTVTWNFGPLSYKMGGTRERTAEFDATYFGEAGQVLTTAITFLYNNVTTPIPVTATGITTATDRCPVENECCENCSNTATTTPELTTFAPCDDHKEPSVDVVVAPKGRRLSVQLRLPQVCDKKDVNVGIFVSEVFNPGTANEIEVPFAHKVIRRSATTKTGTCKADRDCDCVDFMIDDDSACTATRYFRVRTQAHYLDTNADAAPQMCQCATCPVE